MKAAKLVLFGMLVAICDLAWSDCVINGVNYKEGAVVNGYVCDGGEWKKSQ